MKKTIKITCILTFLGCAILFFSCNRENNITEERQLTENLRIFNTQFSKEFSSINWNSKRIVNPSLVNKEAPNIDFIVLEIKLNGYNAYYVEFEEKGFFVDYSKHDKGIQIFNVNNSNEYSLIPFDKGNPSIPDFNSEFFLYRKILKVSELNAGFNWRYSLCIAGCSAITMAIAGTDGPAPFMDILAAAYMVDCGLGCADKWLSE